MRKSIFIALFYLTSLNCFCQWNHDFSSTNLEDWMGDVDVFFVNDQQQLQLNAPEAGDAYIYRSSTIDFDTITFSIFHLLDFAPSDNNKSRIYLALDGIDPASSSGYFMEIGENGSDDALQFYYLDNGAEIFIASASMGALASEPATVRLDIDIFPDGLWSVKTNYSGDAFTSLEIEFVDDQFSFSESQYFGLECTFSASRADKFFYDDIAIQKFVRDTSPPEAVEAEATGDREVLITFSEPVEESDATNLNNYNLANIGTPESIVLVGSLGNQYQLRFSTPFDVTMPNVLTISGISDLNENQMADQMIEFLYAGPPELGDLLLSEILFDPYSGGEDFIEIYNRSSKNIDLIGVEIRNNQREESTFVNGSMILPANSYLAFTEDVDFLVQEYKPETGAIILNQDIPALNNDEGNVTIINAAGVVLDSFDYSEAQHFQLIDDTEGVSLERVSFDVEAENDRNWQSAAEKVRFATPGYENSNSFPELPGNAQFEILTETFSPNQDGEEDQMILSYNLEKSGFTANISVYDAAGFKIKELSNNELLGVQGIITWDGTGSDNQIADLGIYIVSGKLFHPDGEVLPIKVTTVLADFID